MSRSPEASDDDAAAWSAMEKLGAGAADAFARGDLDAAKDAFTRQFDGVRRLGGDDHPQALAIACDLASVLSARGEHAEARALLEGTVATCRETLGEGHPDTSAAMAGLADILLAIGDAAAARDVLETALAAARRWSRGENPSALLVQARLAQVLSAAGDHATSRTHREEILAALRRKLGSEHRVTRIAMDRLAGTLKALGDMAGARDLLAEVLAVRARTLGARDPATTVSAWNLLLVLRELREADAAIGVVNEYLAWLLKADDGALAPRQVELRGHVRRSIAARQHCRLDLLLPDPATLTPEAADARRAAIAGLVAVWPEREGLEADLERLHADRSGLEPAQRARLDRLEARLRWAAPTGPPLPPAEDDEREGRGATEVE